MKRDREKEKVFVMCLKNMSVHILSFYFYLKVKVGNSALQNSTS